MTEPWSKPIVFSEQMKEYVRRPFGELRKGNVTYDETLAKALPLVVVGDYSFRKLLAIGVRPHVVVVDGKIERREAFGPDLSGYKVEKVSNAPGTIQPDAAKAVVAAVVRGDGAVLVDGEEDLLALPAMYVLPPRGVLIYGQPKVGYVVVRPSDEIRKRVVEVLNMATV
ncbi:MAG: DUF359 domain-containing protein [Candidatus Caldarchaeum sp.]|nr:DUF359 domain-containing protein [Candidatus Caldarchaeum sp.]MDW8435033.1 DUF359 domain-containing protein [Candidatus Caldarchaeum sp.]